MSFFNWHHDVSFKCITMVLIVTVFMSCSKKKRGQPLAQTYFKMAVLELSSASQDQSAYKKAIALIDKALHEHEKAEYLALKGTLLFNLGLYEMSECCFKRGLSLERDPAIRAEITNNYACLLAQQGSVAQAEELWKKLQHDPFYQTPEVALVNRGKLAVQRNDFIEAQQLFGNAVALSPSYLDAHLYLGLAAMRLGQKVQARHELDIVLSLEPEHSVAKTVRLHVSV